MRASCEVCSCVCVCGSVGACARACEFVNHIILKQLGKYTSCQPLILFDMSRFSRGYVTTTCSKCKDVWENIEFVI